MIEQHCYFTNPVNVNSVVEPTTLFTCVGEKGFKNTGLGLGIILNFQYRLPLISYSRENLPSFNCSFSFSTKVVNISFSWGTCNSLQLSNNYAIFMEYQNNAICVIICAICVNNMCY